MPAGRVKRAAVPRWIGAGRAARGLIWLLGLGVALGLAGCGSSAGQAVATATPRPAATPATSGPTSSPPAGDPVRLDEAKVRSLGYMPAQQHAETPAGAGGTLYAFLGVCAGSTDGHCQQVFFFVGARYLGTDTKDPSPEVTQVVPAGTATIAVTYGNYRKDDPECCPSGPPVTVRYDWNGSRLVPSGTPPGHT